jgi:hypothetical protein
MTMNQNLQDTKSYQLPEVILSINFHFSPVMHHIFEGCSS